MNMTRNLSHCLHICLIAGLLAATPGFGAGFALPYGTAANQVGFANAQTHPDAEELHPLGPQSFRVIDGTCWVLDSVNSRLHRISASGQHPAPIQLPATAPARIEDFAVITTDGKPTAIFLLDGTTQEVVRVSPTGKVEARFGGVGEQPGQFSQAVRLEVGANNTLVVADRGRHVLSIWSTAGRIQREVDWEWSGFCLDPQGNLCRLAWDELAQRNHLFVETLDGKPVRNVPLQLEAHMNPELWRVDADGEAVVSYCFTEGSFEQFGIARCGADGKVVARSTFAPPRVMNRFFDCDGQAWYLAAADFEQAPQGQFAVLPFDWK